MERRDFLVRTGLALGALGVLAPARLRAADPDRAAPAAPGSTPPPVVPGDWAGVRAQFNLSPGYLHFASFFLASHPKPVRDAIDTHRRGLDEDPVGYIHEHGGRLTGETRAAAAAHLGVEPEAIALTDSTTMGLGLLYSGLRIKPGQEILTTTHDHRSTDTALRLRAERTGASVRRIPLYKDIRTVSQDEIVQSIARAVTAATRIVAVTWVHSSTGLKLPIRPIADSLAAANKGRADDDRILLCVDGVHGIGAESVTLPDLGCDFFIAGTHKWLFGPRGTGFVWGAPHAWPAATATIPSFDGGSSANWMGVNPPISVPPAISNTPGGFHSFEHRWALADAFRFHQSLGKDRIEQRIHALNRRIKEGLAAMSHVRLLTPMDEKLSAGICSFEVNAMKPGEVVERLWERHRIIASASPYAVSNPRLSAGICNTEQEIDAALDAVRAMA